MMNINDLYTISSKFKDCFNSNGLPYNTIDDFTIKIKTDKENLSIIDKELYNLYNKKDEYIPCDIIKVKFCGVNFEIEEK